MTTGVVLLNFGEPSEPDREAVLDYLQKIFLANSDLEDAADPQARAQELARRRIPGLIEEYEEIGGSPLNAQARDQADRLQRLLGDRGYDVETFVGMQYTDPFIEDAVATAHERGVEELIALPSYPLCGPSTTIVALDVLQEAVADREWDVDVQELAGWHTAETYQALRADAIRTAVADHDIDLENPETGLVFSAHGTPKHYLETGSRYDQYVREHCRTIQDRLGIDEYHIGYQNHENRDIPWTEPELEDLVEDLGKSDLEGIVVDPISFVHEQSETLSELDVELAEVAAHAGLEFYRVPIPHGDERLERTFATLLEPFLAGTDIAETDFHQCECRDRPGTMCLNAPHGD